VFDAARVRRVGEIRRRDYHWELDLGLRELAWGQTWKGFLAIRRDGAGRPDGFVRYRAREGWERGQQRGVIDVDDLHTLTDEAYAALWRFLADVDLVATVKAPNRSLSERLPWLLTNGRAANVTELGDGMWVRLLNLPRALAARRYEREGALTLEVIDPDADAGRIRVELEAGDGGATCRTTSRSADLTLDVAALGAAYLGGVRLRDAVLARGADEHRPGALAEADALFRTADEPWCSTHF
jgi:predicted acetyltransferase